MEAPTCNTRPNTCRLQLVLPDVDAAEQPEQHPQDEGQRDGQQRAEQPVEEELDQLKGGMAADPHPVEAVRGVGLGDDVLEADLRREGERVNQKARKSGSASRSGWQRPLPGIQPPRRWELISQAG